MSQALLSVERLSVDYHVSVAGSWRVLQAVRDVSFELQRGQALGIVGESGSGKSSIARALLGLASPSHGSANFNGADLFTMSAPQLRLCRARLQAVFQNPQGSLDPRMRVGEIIAEPLREFSPELNAAGRGARVLAVLESVGLSATLADALPHALSGGQAQRVSIARALVSAPQLLICDEPLSALDVSVKAQIANLLRQLQQQTGLSMLLVSHDLAAVRYLCDHVLVLYLGRVMEVAARESLFATPRHPYTRALLRAVPVADPAPTRAQPLQGELPSPLAPPSGCVFRTRCPYAVQRCALERPALRALGDGTVACHRAEELMALD
jgi:oligopeptide transport system ATP-binding protein